jgi:hypothetical protein
MMLSRLRTAVSMNLSCSMAMLITRLRMSYASYRCPLSIQRERRREYHRSLMNKGILVCD